VGQEEVKVAGNPPREFRVGVLVQVVGFLFSIVTC
jgi:hypothetical protein